MRDSVLYRRRLKERKRKGGRRMKHRALYRRRWKGRKRKDKENEK